MVEPQTVKHWWDSWVTDEGVLVFELITDGSMGPAALGVVSLIVESGTVEVVYRVERAIEKNKGCKIAAPVGNGVLVLPPVVVFKADEAVLPARWAAQGQFSAGQEIVGTGLLVSVGGKQRLGVEVPFALHPGVAVGMPRPHAGQRAGTELPANIASFKLIGVVVVRAFASAVELVAEKVEVPPIPCARDAGKTVSSVEVSAISPKAEFRTVSVPCNAECLNYAGHGVRAVERTLSAAGKLHPGNLRQRNNAEIHGAAGIVHRHIVDQHLVVTGIPTPHKQRG